MKKLFMMFFAIATICVVAMLSTTSASAATSGTTGDCTWTLDGTVLTISGNGEMGNYEYESGPWGTSITEVIIEDGVKSIADYAFYSCASLTSINIPDSVASIGKSAFHSCTSLISINIPDSVTSIGIGAFHSCTSLTSITIPDGVISIGEKAFFRCTLLSSITVSSGNSKYYSEGNCLIEKDTNILLTGCQTSIIPDGVTVIGLGAFAFCEYLTEIAIPNGVTRIEDEAFWNCTSLKSVTIPDSVTSIGIFAFYSCSSLESVVIGKGVVTVKAGYTGGSAFGECNIKTVIIRNPIVAAGLGGSDYAGLANNAEVIYVEKSITTVSKLIYKMPFITQGVAIDGETYTAYSIHALHTCTYSWTSNNTQHWQICDGCDYVGEKSDHGYSNSDDATCNTCGYTRQVGKSDNTTTVIIIAVASVAVIGIGTAVALILKKKK